MPASPQLQRRLQNSLGPEAASDLLEWMQTMDAHRGETADLRRDLQVGFAGIDGRMEALNGRLDGRMVALESRLDGNMNALEARMNGRFEALEARLAGVFEKGLREQTRFFFLAWAVLLAAFIGLSARG